MEPKDFYFQLVLAPQENPPAAFLITLKKYYDAEGVLSDESSIADEIDEILPEGFGELMESTYEFDGNPQTGREILLNLGMIEIDFGFGQGEIPNEHHDEGEEQNEENEEQDEENEEDLDYLLGKDELIKNSSFDYKNLSTDKLLRHKKVMVDNEDYMEAAKIQKELDSRI